MALHNPYDRNHNDNINNNFNGIDEKNSEFC